MHIFRGKCWRAGAYSKHRFLLTTKKWLWASKGDGDAHIKGILAWVEEPIVLECYTLKVIHLETNGKTNRMRFIHILCGRRKPFKMGQTNEEQVGYGTNRIETRKDTPTLNGTWFIKSFFLSCLKLLLFPPHLCLLPSANRQPAVCSHPWRDLKGYH